MPDLPDLKGRIRLDTTDLDAGIRRSTGALSSFGKAALAAGAVAAGGAVVAGKAFISAGRDWDNATDAIRIGTGATGRALKGLEADFKSVVKGVPSDMASVSTAIADLNTRLGLSGRPLRDLSTQFLNLSRITGTEVSANIASMTRVFGDWDVATEKQASTLDSLFRASQSTGAGIDKLAEQVVQFGAPLRQLGFTFEESIGLLGKFEKEGVNAELVMGSMRIALGKMAQGGEPAVETFKRIIEEIKGAGSASEANRLAIELFGARAGPDMAAAVREGRFEIGALLETIRGGEDTINKATADTDGFDESWLRFKNNLAAEVGPAAAKFLDDLVLGLEELSLVFDSNKEASTEWGFFMEELLDDLSAKWADFMAGLEILGSVYRDFVDKWNRSTTRLGNDIEKIADALRKLKGAASFVAELSLPGVIAKKLPFLPSFHQGGIVPGPPSQESLAVLRGGERIDAHPTASGPMFGHQGDPLVKVDIHIDGSADERTVARMETMLASSLHELAQEIRLR